MVITAIDSYYGRNSLLDRVRGDMEVDDFSMYDDKVTVHLKRRRGEREDKKRGRTSQTYSNEPVV